MCVCVCACACGGDSSKSTHAGHTPLRLRTHFSSRFFRRLASIRSRSGGMRGRARRANRRSICNMGQTDTHTDRQTDTIPGMLSMYARMYKCTALRMHYTIESLMCAESRFGTLSFSTHTACCPFFLPWTRPYLNAIKLHLDHWHKSIGYQLQG